MTRQRRARWACCQRRWQDNKSTCLLSGVSWFDVESVRANLIRPATPIRLELPLPSASPLWEALLSPGTWASAQAGPKQMVWTSEAGPSCCICVLGH